MNFYLSIVFCLALIFVPAAARSGQGTWYHTGLGACGFYSSESENIVALSQLLFDTYPGATGNPNLNPVCGQQVQISANGKTIFARAVDRCESCAYNDLDLSPAAFGQLSPLGTGVITIEWDFTGARSKRYMPRPRMDAGAVAESK
ncbi:RlpA-like double-psi beta-barrel-protein domain-containing protein-containing protein [Infundibulicybe gibba]|nr:RlpA-like double-psi beta-barrel-protein domain-containing protein-containing protein [Infundibulicybe gibba]